MEINKKTATPIWHSSNVNLNRSTIKTIGQSKKEIYFDESN